MRTLLVSEFAPPVRGGLERHLHTLAGELHARGHEVRVATLTADPDPIASSVVSLRGATHLLPHSDASRPFHPPVPDPVVRRQQQVGQSLVADGVQLVSQAGRRRGRNGRSASVVPQRGRRPRAYRWEDRLQAALGAGVGGQRRRRRKRYMPRL